LSGFGYEKESFYTNTTTETNNYTQDILDLMDVPLTIPNPEHVEANDTLEENINNSSTNITNEVILSNTTNTTFEIELNNTIEVIVDKNYTYNSDKLTSKQMLEQERSVAKVNENLGIMLFYICDHYGIYINPNLPNKTYEIAYNMAQEYKLILTKECLK